MAKNKYYYYDHGHSSFVEVEPKRTRLYHAAAVLALALLLSGALVYGMDVQWIGTPQETALKAENTALRRQMKNLNERMTAFADDLDHLSETDQELYRKLLQAEPISEDVRQVGVGGADAYEQFDRFGGKTSALMRETAQTIDELERRVSLQSASFEQLSSLARHHQAELAQLPAILPANGPVVSGYGLRRHPILHVRKMHKGLDLLVRTGTPVVAPGNGVVRRTGYGPGYGRFIEIEHPETGYSTFYGHLSEVADGIDVGRAVKRGEKIALSGNTGRSTGPHLHYEVRDAEGRAVNPVYFFAPSMTPKHYRALLAETRREGVSLD